MDRLLASRLGQQRTAPTRHRRSTVRSRTVGPLHVRAYVVMPNHVHLLITPQVEVPTLLRSLKSITAKRANQILGLTGRAFWQEESYDHLVRDGKEFERIRGYIEENPVWAGLVAEAGEYRWSSAYVGEAGRGAGCGPGGPPHSSNSNSSSSSGSKM